MMGIVPVPFIPCRLRTVGNQWLGSDAAASSSSGSGVRQRVSLRPLFII
jgi:hypothetical protein